MTQRTPTQNDALHLGLERMADAMNDAGYDQKLFFAEIEKLEIPNTKESMKAIFRAIAHQLYQVESTTELTTTQIQETYDAMNRGLAQKFGVQVPWPSIESIMNEQQEKQRAEEI